MVPPPIGVVKLAIFQKMNARNIYIERRATWTSRVACASKLKKWGKSMTRGSRFGSKSKVCLLPRRESKGTRMDAKHTKDHLTA